MCTLRYRRTSGFDTRSLFHGVCSSSSDLDRYDGANAVRLHHVLHSIMRPKACPQDAGGIEVALHEWEHLVQRWEILASDHLNDAVKRRILLDTALLGIRVQLTLAGHQSYETLSAAIMSYFSLLEIGTRQLEHRSPLEHPLRRWKWMH